ncbi:hypothetical protein FBY58_1865 [Zymomonas mobilis]|uniref:Uncharacterized protein n=1 Tax=Zymomonas mobilis TaxID=542 RepID=A0A542VUE9_ZYMMB|nr:hypothetical protein FBY58_1865 [Zymomonas mobilis]
MAQELKLEISIISIARYRDFPKSSWDFDRIKNPYRASKNNFALARLNKIRWTTMFVILGINKVIGRNIIDCDLPSIR